MSRQRRDIPWLTWRAGIAYVNWYDENLRRTGALSLRTGDQMEAKKRYVAFLTEGQDILTADRDGPVGLTVTKALDDYVKEHVDEKVIDKTRAKDIVVHLKAFFKDTLFRDVDIPLTRAYADARRTGAVGGGKQRPNAEGSDGTIRRELVVLSAAANHAARWKRIGPKANPPSPMPSIELPAESREEAPWLTKTEFNLAVTSCPAGRLLDFILVAYYTAGRRASVERLTKFQVDLTQSRINLTAPTEDANQRRSKKRRPIIPIDPKVRPTIERLMATGDTMWLFGSPADMYRPFREHMTSIGLGEKSNPHILRHSRATHLLQDGVGIYDVAKLLGDTVATVERVYGHHSPDYLGEAIKGAG